MRPRAVGSHSSYLWGTLNCSLVVTCSGVGGVMATVAPDPERPVRRREAWRGARAQLWPELEVKEWPVE